MFRLWGDQPGGQPTIIVGDAAVPLLIQPHPRARGYRLRLDRRGVARLTIPTGSSRRRALDWARGQTEWLAGQLESRKAVARPLADGGAVLVEGQMVTICWSQAHGRTLRLEGDALLLGGPPELVGTRVLRWLKARARTILTEETCTLAVRHGLPLASVSIGDAASRWGSCASSGAIRYSWRLIMAPPDVRIATVAHEVAHLRHMDHSPAFHAFHRAICPSDTMAARAWLRENGARLHAVTA